MKVYTKLVIDLKTFETIEEQSFDYSGPLAYCKGGGGGGGQTGGGGGSSGAVSYPTYMQTIHGKLMDHQAADAVTSSLVDLVNVAIGVGGNPYTGETAYDPDTDITAMETAIGVFDTYLSALDPGSDYVGLMATIRAEIDANIIDNTTLDAEIAAFTATYDDQLTTTVIPRFEVGLRDINAVQSSAYAIGKANIESSRDRDIAKFSADLRLQAYQQRNSLIASCSEAAMKMFLNVGEYNRVLVNALLEQKRLKIIAKSDQAETQLGIDDSDAQWDLQAFQHLGNMLAAIGGGTAVYDTWSGKAKKPSALAGGLSGALSGGSTGAMVGMGVGGPVGALIGGGAGALLGAGASMI